jgi:hypothetical protein
MIKKNAASQVLRAQPEAAFFLFLLTAAPELFGHDRPSASQFTGRSFRTS